MNKGPRAQQDPERPLAAFKELPVGGRLLGQMVLVDLRNLPPVGQDTAENLGHRPLQSRYAAGGERPTPVCAQTLSCKTGGSQGAGGMICTAPSPTSRFVVTADPRASHAGQVGSTRCAASTNRGGSGRRALSRKAARNAGWLSGDTPASGRRRSGQAPR